MPRRRYRTAIVGTGGIAAVHAKALAEHGDRAELIAVVDVNPERVATFAAARGVPSVYGSVSALLSHAEVDLIHLCTPPFAHAPLALECLRAGVPVLIEKPPSVSLAELDTLAAMSRESGAHVATVFQHRFGAGAIRLRSLTNAGALGRPLLATCNTLWYRDDAYFDVAWRGRWETEGGGPTMGHGIHQFDLMLSILGPWESVLAVAARRARHVETEDVSMALVTFASGAVASVVNSVVSPRQTSALRFDFERATVELEHLYGYTDENWTVTAAPGHSTVESAWAADTRPASVSGHAAQLCAVYDALDAGTPPPVGLDEARQTMEFIAALYASAFTGEIVHSGQIGPGNPFAQRMNGAGAPWQTT